MTISLNNMAGGLEKNFTLLANHLAQQGKNVHVITFDLPGASSYYKFIGNINWHQVARTPPHSPINFWQRFYLLARVRKVLKSLEKPIIICFHHGILARVFFSSLGLSLPIICSERNSLDLYNHITQTRKWSLSFLLLALTKRITVQFPHYIQDYPWWLRNRIDVISNPIASAKTHAIPNKPSPKARFFLIQVGRLCDQKNQILLINAFSEICDENPLWDLYLVGDGEFKSKVLTQIKKLDLTNRVFLLGACTNIPELLSNSHIFCMPSKWEGFPNALAEAMAHGLPAIGLQKTAGVKDLIVHNKTGLLCDEEELPQMLQTLMRNPDMRASMGQKSISHIAKYTSEKTFQLWDKLLTEISDH